MAALKVRARQLVCEEGGATATEYAVMLGLIILTAFGSIATLGPTVASKLVIPGW